MEESIALLMADLSGYTALTEAHGASSAADLIDKYLEIVQDCLVGDSELKERTGDEVLIISTSPDFLIATAILIQAKTVSEHQFLQLHGGLHYGSLLKRKNSYFGSAINFTARIAAKAGANSFWCSEDFAQALTTDLRYTLCPKGKHRFKNMAEEKELFEIVSRPESTFRVDPVCRMQIVDTLLAVSHPEQPDVYFCSLNCLHTFAGRQ